MLNRLTLIPAGGHPAHSRSRRETRNSDLVIGGGSNNSEFRLSFATKDGAEPSLERLPDAGAVPAASTTNGSLCRPQSMGSGQPDARAHSAIADVRGPFLMGAKQTRRPADDRSCTRNWSTSQTTNHNCEQRQRSRRSAPRGVAEAAFAGHVATEARHSIREAA